jgi:hypothetical protein
MALHFCFFNGVPIGTSLHFRRVGLGGLSTEPSIEESLDAKYIQKNSLRRVYLCVFEQKERDYLLWGCFRSSRKRNAITCCGAASRLPAVEQLSLRKRETSACRGEGSAAGLQLRVRFVPAALLAMLRTALPLQCVSGARDWMGHAARCPAFSLLLTAIAGVRLSPC